MSFTDLDRSLRSPPLSPLRRDELGSSKRSLLSISTADSVSIRNSPLSPVSPPLKLPIGIQVTQGNSRDSIGLNLQPQLQQRHPHTSAPHPPPVSPKRGVASNNPLALHSRFLEDNTRFDTPRPTLTSSDVASASSTGSSSSTGTGIVTSPRGPQAVSTSSSSNSSSSSSGSSGNLRILGNPRMLGDQDRRRIPSPLTDFPQLTPPSSPPSYNYNQFRGFVRVDNPSPPDSGATATATTTHTFESNTNTNNDTIIHMDPETGVTFSPASSIHGTAAAVAAHTTTTTSAEDDSETTAWVTATIQDQDHDYDLMVRHVSQQIFNISSNIAVLERLIPCLGQRHKDTPEMRESLHAVLNGTQDLVKSAHALIKALSKYHHPPPAAPQSNIGLRVQPTVSPNQLTSWQRKVLAGRRQTHQRLTKDLTLASKSFQDLQRQAVEAERRQVATLKRLSVSPSLKRLTNYRSGPASPVGLNVMEMTQEESEKLPLLGGSNSVKKQNGSIVSGGASSATFDGIGLEPHNRELSVQEEALLREILILDGEVAFQETIIQEREFEIQKMEEGMGQVLDVMRELGTLVHEQRDGIDYLHDNIAQVRTRTHIAQQEVLKASEYQRRAREKLCYLIMITSIVGALVMLAFVST